MSGIGVLVRLEETFKPHPSMIKLYSVYLLIAVIPDVILGLIATWLVFVFAPEYTYVPPIVVFVPMILICGVVLYWTRRYYQSITYRLTRDEVVVEGGVWWKMKHTVPYARIMSVDTIQGPISRKFGIATVDVYTAGYTGVSGGTGGPSNRRAEASIIHVSDFAGIREKVLSIVRGKPLFSTRTQDADSELLSEVRKIRELLEE
jgi:membrane protein YdbS with pleckstrin-like domain